MVAVPMTVPAIAVVMARWLRVVARRGVIHGPGRCVIHRWRRLVINRPGRHIHRRGGYVNGIAAIAIKAVAAVITGAIINIGFIAF